MNISVVIGFKGKVKQKKKNKEDKNRKWGN